MTCELLPDAQPWLSSHHATLLTGMAIFDTMRHIRPDVSTVCVGLAASMGAFLLASGHQGKRYSLPNSRIMIHQPLGGAQGQAADIEIQANEILHHKLTLNGYLAEFTGAGWVGDSQGVAWTSMCLVLKYLGNILWTCGGDVGEMCEMCTKRVG